MSNVRPPECGVDYLTTTWHDEIRDTPLQNTRQVIDWAERQTGKRGLGSITKAWAWQGYRGWQCGQLCVGERLDGTVLRVSGAIAHKWMLAGLPIGHNVSRIDIALTIWGFCPQSEVIALHSEEADRYRKSLQSRPFDVRLIDGFGNGDTLYIGARSSDLFTRIYDKEREQKNDDNWKEAIRYECECKNGAASVVRERLVTTRYTAASCLEILVGLLSRRGIYPLGVGSVTGVVLQPSALPISSVESIISWLESQVRPNVRKLMREGYELEVLEALGLGRYYNAGFEGD